MVIDSRDPCRKLAPKRFPMKKFLLLPLVLCISLVTAKAQTYFPEPGNWASKAPKDLGIDPNKLQEALRFAEAKREHRKPKSENRSLRKCLW